MKELFQCLINGLNVAGRTMFYNESFQLPPSSPHGRVVAIGLLIRTHGSSPVKRFSGHRRDCFKCFTFGKRGEIV